MAVSHDGAGDSITRLRKEIQKIVPEFKDTDVINVVFFLVPEKLKRVSTIFGDYVQVLRHGKKVWAREDLDDQQCDSSLCWKCSKFHPDIEDEEDNCHIARQLFDLCKTHSLVTPVWECPEFEYRRV